MADLISRAALLKDLSYCAPELWQDEEYIKAKIMKQPAVDAVPVKWLSSKAAQAEHDIFYCKGDARRNAEIMRSAIVVMELWKKEQEAR